jgi:sensory rhodopsin
METLTDVALNPDPYLQKGDLVAAALFFESIAMTAIVAFLLFQVNHVPRRYRQNIVVGVVMMLCAAIAAFYRRDFWIETGTNPVEFKFFDWFVTVPLMGVQFFLLARPHGVKVGFIVRLFLAITFMLVCGYLGEAIFPEQAILTGVLATIGLIGIISFIMLEGFPKVAKNSQDQALVNGYKYLGLSLPLTWLAYPMGYLSVPGNLLEGYMAPETVLILYAFANILSKGGLVMAVYFIATFSLEAQGKAADRSMHEIIHSEREEKRGSVLGTNGPSPTGTPAVPKPPPTPWN